MLNCAAPASLRLQLLNGVAKKTGQIKLIRLMTSGSRSPTKFLTEALDESTRLFENFSRCGWRAAQFTLFDVACFDAGSGTVLDPADLTACDSGQRYTLFSIERPAKWSGVGAA